MIIKHKQPNQNILRWTSWLVAFGLTLSLSGLIGPYQAAYAVTNMLLFWDGASAPSGWTVVSDGMFEPFYHVFIRGSDSYSPPLSSTTTHTHTISWVSSTINAALTMESVTGSDFGSATHEHNSIASPSVSSETIVPPYRELQVISCDAGTSCTVPDNAIAIFDAAPTSGTWTRYSAQDDTFIRGGADGEATGGAATHTHSVSFTTGAPSATAGSVDSGGKDPVSSSGTSSHTHTAADVSAPASHVPENVDILLYQNTAGSAASAPAGMIAMFNGAPGGGWNTISDSGETFYHKYMEANSTYAASGGGSATHTHTNLAARTGAPSAIDMYLMDPPEEQIPLDGEEGFEHAHDVEVSFSSTNNAPTTIDVIIAQKTSYTPATKNWRWFDAEDTADPNTTNGGGTTTGDAMAAEDTQPTSTRVVYKLNAFKLRIVVGETAATAGTDVKYKLQYDTATDFASATDVDAQGGTSALFRYYDGDNVADDGVISTTRLTGSPTAGRHNEDATTGIGAGSTFDPAASTDYEHEFTIQNYNGANGTDYYFRLQYMEESDAAAGSWTTVALGGGEAYPSVRTAAAADLEIASTPGTVDLGEYTKGGTGTHQYIFAGGEEIVFWDKRGSGAGYSVTANTLELDCAGPIDTIPGTDITWTSAIGSLNGSFASDAGSITGNTGQTLDANRTAYNAGSLVDPTSQTGGFYFLPTLDFANLNDRQVCGATYDGTLTITIA